MRVTRRIAGEVEVDLGRYELRRGGRRIKLETKPMELLIFLIGRREQMVPREEIVKKLWRSDLFIDTEKNLNNVVRKLRTALGDKVDSPRFLETVVGKGYRFVGPVRIIAAKQPGSAERKPAHDAFREDGIESERISVAVVPLLLLGKWTDDHGLCLGFADALVSRLGNLFGVDVLPTSAVLSVPPEATPSEIAFSLGVRFVIHGAVQMSKGQWRISLEMFDTRLERSLFAKKCDLEIDRLLSLVDGIAQQVSASLNRPSAPAIAEQRPRYSKDPLAYAEFMRGYRITASGDSSMMSQAIEHLTNAVTRDPAFALAHATLSFACSTRHFEFDPSNLWLERAEFHCRRALEIDANIPEGHVACAFLLWGPSKNFQHLEAIAELKRALALQSNLPHAYNRLGTILAHIGLLDRAREMFQRGRPFQPKMAISPSIVQVYIWGQEYELARQQIHLWRTENPGNKYPIYYAPQLAMMTGEIEEAGVLLDQAMNVLPEEPLLVSLQGIYHVLNGDDRRALDCVSKACASPKSFGHAHHCYYQIACIFALLGRHETAFDWLERSVSSGFACWPFFLKDPCLENLRGFSAFEALVSSLQAKYPDHVGLF
ncbi:TPR end-of-group domain-containing protein [Occallatibacter savannae]|uniref:TPR end-of-group domain-containing protein n=1 Tax=Occallatibacter savannae TaxID=1002691 RepID=UPI000D69344C|nr:winged helix-turn-helix domain-containing protein [Occallatibacter savannae]